MKFNVYFIIAVVLASVLLAAITLILLSIKKKGRSKESILRNQSGLDYYKANLPDRALEEFQKASELNPKDYSALYNTGMVLIQKNQYPEAIEQFEKAILIKRDKADIFVNLGLAYYLTEKFSKAVENFNRSLVLDMKNPQVYYYLGLVYLETKNHEKASKSLFLALEFDPNNVDARFKLANLYFETENFGLAEKEYLKLSDKIKDKPIIYQNLGEIAYKLKKYDESILYYKKALSISKRSQSILLKIAEIYYHILDYNNAKIILREILVTNNMHEAYLLLGDIQFLEFELEQSIETINKAVFYSNDKTFSLGSFLVNKMTFLERTFMQQKDDIKVILSLAFVKFHLKKFAEAEDLFKKAVAINGSNVFSHFYLGLSILEKKEYQKAIDEFLIAINLQPTHARAHNACGTCYMFLMDFDNAIESFNKAHKLDLANKDYKEDLDNVLNAKLESIEKDAKKNPRNVELLFDIARTLYLKGEYDVALDKLKDVLYKLPSFYEAIILVAEIQLEQKKDTHAAAEAYKKAITFYPNNSEIRIKLAQLLITQNKYNEAFEQYNDVLYYERNNDVALSGIADCYKFRNEYKNASDYYKKTLEVNPNNSNAFLGLGDIEKINGNISEAVVNYNKSISLDSRSWMAFYKLGNVYFDLHDFPKAIENYKKSIEINGDHPNSRFNLAIALKDIGKSREALFEFENFLAKYPNSSDTRTVSDIIRKLKRSA